MISSFRDFEVYKESYELALRVYEASKSFPKEERYGLTSQIQRAAISIPLNVAEGYGKQESAAEFKRYLRMALGSGNEMEVLLDFCRDLEYMKKEENEALKERYISVRKKLYRLEQNWK